MITRRLAAGMVTGRLQLFQSNGAHKLRGPPKGFRGPEVYQKNSKKPQGALGSIKGYKNLSRVLCRVKWEIEWSRRGAFNLYSYSLYHRSPDKHLLWGPKPVYSCYGAPDCLPPGLDGSKCSFFPCSYLGLHCSVFNLFLLVFPSHCGLERLRIKTHMKYSNSSLSFVLSDTRLIMPRRYIYIKQRKIIEKLNHKLVKKNFLNESMSKFWASSEQPSFRSGNALVAQRGHLQKVSQRISFEWRRWRRRFYMNEFAGTE